MFKNDAVNPIISYTSDFQIYTWWTASFISFIQNRTFNINKQRLNTELLVRRLCNNIRPIFNSESNLKRIKFALAFMYNIREKPIELRSSCIMTTWMWRRKRKVEKEFCRSI